ncbi:MAG: hypothetical protein ACOYMP_11865 [Nodosilinea sp.]
MAILLTITPTLYLGNRSGLSQRLLMTVFHPGVDGGSALGPCRATT